MIKRDGDRTLVQERKLKKRGQGVATYETIGLPSYVFLGLTSVQTSPSETVRVLEPINQ